MHQNNTHILYQAPSHTQIQQNDFVLFRSTTQSPSVRSCIASCPVTSEYNPVCGSDNVTYSNPGRLICAQMCGVGEYLTA